VPPARSAIRPRRVVDGQLETGSESLEQAAIGDFDVAVYGRTVEDLAETIRARANGLPTVAVDAPGNVASERHDVR
jgi:hypothetical protein